MYAVLGTTQFEVIAYFEGMDAHISANYAEHGLINGKPRLQAVGKNLDEFRLQLLFHAAYCHPESELAKLKMLVDSQEARQFVMGNGVYQGWFVMVDVDATSRQTDGLGNLMILEAAAVLREYVEPVTLETRRIEATKVATEKRAAATKKVSAKPPTAGAGRGFVNNGYRAPSGT